MDPLKYIVPGRKRLPYGMMNFADIRQDNYYYVDKTRFIPMIEEADRFFFFIRPRRFGKSLTLNVLQHYYDVRTRDKFDDLFGDLYIGQHPTPSRNTYLVLYLMRINQLREEGAKEDIDLKPALKDYYSRHMTEGTFVSWICSSISTSARDSILGNCSSCSYRWRNNCRRCDYRWWRNCR